MVPKFILLSVIVLSIMNVGQAARLVIDQDADIVAPWDNQCVSGYHQLQTFSCDQGPLLPPAEYTGNVGYWARCSVFFVQKCDIIYRPPNSTAWKQVFVDGYFMGNTAIEVIVEHTGGFLTRFLQASRGWQTVVLDMSQVGRIIEITVKPEYIGPTYYTVIDKITLDDEAPATTTTTPRPSTTTQTTNPSASTTVPPTGSTTAPPATTPPATTTPPTTTAPPATTALPRFMPRN